MKKVGFNLLAWSAVVSDELLPMAERLKKIGYDGIECFIGAEDKQVYRDFGREIGDLGLEMTCVMVLGPEENPISPSAEVRQKGLDRIKWAVDRADDMDAGLLCGPFHSAFATFHDKSPDQDEYKRSAEVLAKAGDYAAQADIVLAPEAINRFECYLCNTMEQLVYLVEQAAHPNVKAHFDTHHANIEEKKLAGAIKKVAPVLGHVHISENDRGTPGSGHIPWDETFGALADIGYDGWLTIEAFTRDDPDFANSINVWREYNKPWDVAEQGYTFIKKMCEKYGL
ncbi:sugar phosphate isomerase/epimerase family protein [Fodinibius sp.]|uniref:sugar phosphate isomerase/epimerase family protein n=1 Tax=Fodinibius sp. TaxID=1872440 RepID=UPI00356986D0